MDTRQVIFKLPDMQEAYEKELAEIRAKAEKAGWSDASLQKVARLTAQKYQAKEKAKFAERRRNAALLKVDRSAKSKERTEDTHRKIIIGGALLADPALAETLSYIVNNLTRDSDRAAFGLPPL